MAQSSDKRLAWCIQYRLRFTFHTWDPHCVGIYYFDVITVIVKSQYKYTHWTQLGVAGVWILYTRYFDGTITNLHFWVTLMSLNRISYACLYFIYFCIQLLFATFDFVCSFLCLCLYSMHTHAHSSMIRLVFVCFLIILSIKYIIL